MESKGGNEKTGAQSVRDAHTGKTLQWEAQKGWRRIARRTVCSDWLQLLNKIRTNLR